MTTNFAGRVLGRDTHANRPAATDVAEGAMYSCSDHAKVYRATSGSWTDWLTLGDPPSLPTLYTDTLPLHADGDDFDDAGLTGWTLGGGLSTGDVTAVATEPFDATALDIVFASSGYRMVKAMPVSDNIELTLSFYGYTNATPSPTTAVAAMIGLFLTTSGGTGTGLVLYTSTANAYLWPMSSWSQTGSATAIGGIAPSVVTAMLADGYPVVLKLKKVGTTLTGSISLNGLTWWSNTRTDSTTHTHMGIARIFTGGGTNPRMRVGRFNVEEL